MRTRAGGLAMAAALLGGCLGVADDRARRDREIGQGSGGGLTVAVDEGLAHVRAIGAGGVTLWAQAPVVRLTLARDAAAATAPLEVTVDNALADATLSVEGGAVLESLPPDQPRPTRRRWRLPAAPSGGAGDSQRLLLAPPDREDRAPFRVAVFADVQERIDDVQDIYARMNQDPRIRFVLMSGDLTNRGSAAQLARFQHEMRTLAFPIYATLGNHELGRRDDLFHDHFGRGSFSFAFRGARFTLLDSASATISPLTLESLEGWLGAGAGGFHLLAMHIPPFDPVGLRGGGFSSRLEAARLCSQMAAAGVDLNVYGHVHSFYAYANAGIPAYITGGGGAIPERFDGIGRHFLTVDLDPATSLFQVAVVRVD
jgi:3',5'-cyclic-AMP phosphodiesterase